MVTSKELVKILEIVVSAQSDVDAVAAICQTASQNLSTAAPLLEAAIQSGSGGTVDTSALVAAGQALVPAVNAITALVPTSGTTPPGGTTTNAQGQLVNAQGQFVDANGNVVSTPVQGS